MVLGWVIFAVKVTFREIVEDVKIIKEVLSYHLNELNENRSQTKQSKKLKKKMQDCETYEEWVNYAYLHDNLKDKKVWKQDPTSAHYNYEYVAHLRDQLKDDRVNKRIMRIIHTLRSHAFRNIGNILNPNLYKHCLNSTKELIESFENEVDECIMYIATTTQLEIRKKMEFFIEMRHAVGRTALVLSGGGLMGMYHIGVIKTLYEQKLLPRIISGSSAGSIIASFLCSKKFEEIPNIFTGMDDQSIKWTAFQKRNPKGQIKRKIQRFINEGVLLDVQVLVDFTKDNIGDITFQEAYDRTGFVLNITVTGENQNDQDRILNYLSAPNVIIRSAVCCSCGIPYIYGSSDLLCKNEKGEVVKYLDKNKKFVDGSIGADLPMHKLSEFFNVNNFIVSQTNPWVVPFIDKDHKISFTKTPFRKIFHVLYKFINSEIKHRCRQMLEFGLISRTAEKWLNIILQNYEGNITIAPVPRWSDYANILEVPTKHEDFLHFMQGGASKTFSKVPQIKAFMRYENSLAEGFAKVKSMLAHTSGEEIELEVSVENDSEMMDALEEEDEIHENTDQKGGSVIRNFSFTVPRSKSKDILDQLNQMGVKQAKIKQPIEKEQIQDEKPILNV